MMYKVGKRNNVVKIVGHVEFGNEKKEREAKDSMELTWAKHLGPINAATHDKISSLS